MGRRNYPNRQTGVPATRFQLLQRFGLRARFFGRARQITDRIRVVAGVES